MSILKCPKKRVMHSRALISTISKMWSEISKGRVTVRVKVCIEPITEVEWFVQPITG